jgi:hypothetical protein
MDKRTLRLAGWVVVWLLGCALWWYGGEPSATAASEQWTVPPAPPLLTNPHFECEAGYTPGVNPIGEAIAIPNGWNVIFLRGNPRLVSTRLWVNQVCDRDDRGRHIERFDFFDSLMIRSQDIETLPEPGKSFDVVIYHRIPATWGGAYSLSAWMTSKCGNTTPVDCPDGNYIAKMLGIDPHGGTDPRSPAIAWAENRANLGPQNLFTAATALEETDTHITVFARMDSPFQFHGNLGFMDAFSLIRAPVSALATLPAIVEKTGEVELKWDGDQSPDVAIINNNGGTYRLLFDVQARPLPNGEWRDLFEGGTTGKSAIFTAPCLETSYEFRVRARAEQAPPPPDGVQPNHRYPGVWTKAQTVFFAAPEADITAPTQAMTTTLYMPVTVRGNNRVC